jgi:hypothetical protein
VAETSAFKKYAWESRLAVGAREYQDILIGWCWVLPEGRRLFHAFPKVVKFLTFLPYEGDYLMDNF